MNTRILYSLLVSLGLYAGNAMGMLAPLAPTAQQLGGAASRGATALGAAASRYRMPRPGVVPASRAFSTIPEPTAWSPSEETPTSYTKRGPGLGQRSALFRSTQIRRPAGSRPMSTSSTSNYDAPITKQEAAKFLGIDINASPEEAEKAALRLRKIYYTKIWHPDPYVSGEAALQAHRLIEEALSFFKPGNAAKIAMLPSSDIPSKALITLSDDQRNEDYYYTDAEREAARQRAIKVGLNTILSLITLVAAGRVIHNLKEAAFYAKNNRQIVYIQNQLNELESFYQKLMQLEASDKVLDEFERAIFEILDEYELAITLVKIETNEQGARQLRARETRTKIDDYQGSLYDKIAQDLIDELNTKIKKYEKVSSDLERKQTQQKQSYTDWARGNMYYYWNRLKNATGQAK